MLMDSEKHPVAAPFSMTMTLYFAMNYLGLTSFYSYAAVNNERAKIFNNVLGEEIPSELPKECKFSFNKEDIEKNEKYLMVLRRIKDKRLVAGTIDRTF